MSNRHWRNCILPPPLPPNHHSLLWPLVPHLHILLFLLLFSFLLPPHPLPYWYVRLYHQHHQGLQEQIFCLKSRHVPGDNIEFWKVSLLSIFFQFYKVLLLRVSFNCLNYIVNRGPLPFTMDTFTMSYWRRKKKPRRSSKGRNSWDGGRGELRQAWARTANKPSVSYWYWFQLLGCLSEQK